MVHVTVTALGAQGDGVAHIDGRTIFIDGVLPNEIVDIAIDKTGNRGQVQSIIKPSVIREVPPCRHFENCGGCALQHMQRAAYQSWKYEAVQSYLTSKHIIPRTWGSPVFIDANTRRRADFSLLKRGKKLIIGLHEKRSHSIIDIQECPILDPDIASARDYLSQELSKLVPDNSKGGVFIQKMDNGLDVVLTSKIGAKGEPDLNSLETIARIVQSSHIIRFSWRLSDRDIPQVLIERDKPVVKFGSLFVSPQPLAFLQPSVAGQDSLIKVMLEYLATITRVGGTFNRAADLFSGCGTFTGALVAQKIKTDAYEGDKQAIETLKTAEHQSSFQRNLFKDPLAVTELKPFDIVVIDPPRAGAVAQMDKLAQSDVKNIIAVSCNPASFARDSAVLLDGGYKLERLTMVDQFIWSAHTELVAHFTRTK